MKENYINYITYTRQYSDSTIRWYSTAIREFDSYLRGIWKNIDDPENIRLIDVYNFIEDKSKSWLTARTCAWYSDWVRNYLKYCKDILELDVLDYHKIKSPKVPDREIWFYSKEEKKMILNAVNKWIWKSERVILRNKLLTYMLLQTWLRCHEIAKIKVCEIWESLQVIWKWWKRRFVYLRPEVLDLVYLYLAKRNRKSDYLFDWYKDWHLMGSRIRSIFQTISKKVWFHVHAHKFRHTFATDLLHIPWANVYSVSTLLWHKSINTTQIYLWASNSELKKLQFSLEI